jgi:predicted DNA-binding transcriptional regulator AlpA
MSIETGTSAGAFDSMESTITACLERLINSDELREWEPSGPALDCKTLTVVQSDPVLVPQIEGTRQRDSRQPAADQGSVLSDYLTKKQLAAELGRSIRTIDRWLLQGDGPPPTTLGMEQLFRRDGVREWLLAKEQKRPRRRI